MLCAIAVEKRMDPLVGLDQHTPPDQQTTLEQQAAIQQERTSDQFQVIPPDQITQEGNEAYLRQHQSYLRNSYPSCDLSEVSYYTEHTDFPGSRHSSLHTEPLTLDADQIHDAKDEAVDILQKADTDAAFEIFTKDLKIKGVDPFSQESDAKALDDQISAVVDKAQQVVVANEQQSGSKISGTASASSEEKNRPEESATSLEEDVNLKAE